MGIGSDQGWHSVLIRKRTAKDGVMSEDYHSDINADNFLEWFKPVLASLPKNSVIVSKLL